MSIGCKSAGVAESEPTQAAAPLSSSFQTPFLHGVPELLTLADLAVLLQVHLNTVRADLHRRPETLPPRMLLPGRRIVRFLKRDVATWLMAARNDSPLRAVTAVSPRPQESGE